MTKLKIKNPIPASRTIDMTPTWTETARMLTVLLEEGTEEGKRVAREEIHRMGEIIDALQKEAKA